MVCNDLAAGSARWPLFRLSSTVYCMLSTVYSRNGCFICRVVVRSESFELGGAGVNELVDRGYSVRQTSPANLTFRRVPKMRQLSIGEAVLLRHEKQFGIG